MSKTIEIPRELAERIADWYDGSYGGRIIEEMGELRALLAAPVVERQEPVAWANDQQLMLCSKSPREVQPNNPMVHDLPRNIAGSALRTDYCNTPLYTSPPAPVAVVLPKDPEKSFLEWASTLPSPPRCLQSYLAAIDKVKELNQ